jgi:hypothetical protein
MEQFIVIVHEVDHDNSRYDAYILGEGVYQSEGDYLVDISEHFQSVLEEDATLVQQSSYKIIALTSEGPKYVDQLFMSEMESPEAKANYDLVRLQEPGYGKNYLDAEDPTVTDLDYGVGDLD